MINKIKKLENNSKLIYYFGRFVRRVIFRYKSLNIGFESILWNLFRTSKFDYIRRNKNNYNQQRCFIIATGPSLTISDLEKLNNEFTFSMNSIVLAFQETHWRPTFYGIQDERVFEKLKNEIMFYMNENYLLSSDICKKHKIRNANQFLINSYYFKYDLRYNDKYYSKFSNNASRIIYDGYTITYSLIQIAVYFGFKEIILLGADFGYKKDQPHHFKEHGVIDENFSTAYLRMRESYLVAKKNCEEKGVRIINATRGGNLELFERIDFDEILSKNIGEY
jgi:hypothetical protein